MISLVILSIQVIRQFGVWGRIVGGADVVGVGDVDEGAVGVAGEEVVIVKPCQESTLFVLGFAVYIEGNQAILPVVVCIGKNGIPPCCIA